MIGIIPQPEENTTEEKVLLVQSYEYLGLKEDNTQKDFNEKIIEKTKEISKDKDAGGTGGFSEQNLKFEPLNETTADVENNIAKLKNTAFFKSIIYPKI